jgi:hypothetical protein
LLVNRVFQAKNGVVGQPVSTTRDGSLQSRSGHPRHRYCLWVRRVTISAVVDAEVMQDLATVPGASTRYTRLVRYRRHFGSPGNELIRQFAFPSFSTGASPYLGGQLRLHVPRRNHSGFRPTFGLRL